MPDQLFFFFKYGFRLLRYPRIQKHGASCYMGKNYEIFNRPGGWLRGQVRIRMQSTGLFCRASHAAMQETGLCVPSLRLRSFVSLPDRQAAESHARLSLVRRFLARVFPTATPCTARTRCATTRPPVPRTPGPCRRGVKARSEIPCSADPPLPLPCTAGFRTPFCLHCSRQALRGFASGAKRCNPSDCRTRALESPGLRCACSPARCMPLLWIRALCVPGLCRDARAPSAGARKAVLFLGVFPSPLSRPAEVPSASSRSARRPAAPTKHRSPRGCTALQRTAQRGPLCKGSSKRRVGFFASRQLLSLAP